MFTYFANPLRFQKTASILAPIFGWLGFTLLIFGTYKGIWDSPEDFRQGHSVRIMYVHVPAAWCALMAYSIMAVFSFISYVWRHALADYIARACAIPGAIFTALALITGSVWGKTSWGTWWEWDGRMTSMLILFFIYLGYICIWHIILDPKRAARIAGLVAMVGAINLPIIKYSVVWWRGQHQGTTVSSFDAPGLVNEMLIPLLTMALAYTLIFGWAVMRLVLADIERAKSRRIKFEHSGELGATATIEELS